MKTVATNLDRLNELLAKRSLDIPAFRRHVGPSLNNLKWLKSVLLERDDLDKELRALLIMDQKELVKKHEIPESR